MKYKEGGAKREEWWEGRSELEQKIILHTGQLICFQNLIIHTCMCMFILVQDEI